MGKTLVLRRTQSGGIRAVGGWPDEHVFALSWLMRALAEGEATISVTVKGDEGPVAYSLTGFDPHQDQHGQAIPDQVTGEPKLNYTAWRCEKVEG